MSDEIAKEAAKIIIETSGTSLSGVLAWATGLLGAAGVALWGHVTGRLKKIEEQMVTTAYLKSHVDDENKKFDLLFNKNDGMMEKINTIAADVAHIKGRLDQ